MDELRREVDLTIASHRGLEKRSAYIEQVHEEFEQLLHVKLQPRTLRSARKLVQKLLYGDALMAPELFGGLGLMTIEEAGRLHAVSSIPFAGYDDALRLIPTTIVNKGVHLLHTNKPSVLDPDIAEVYRPWRKLYGEAAKRGEAVLVLNA
jgi:hypothetical protein